MRETFTVITLITSQLCSCIPTLLYGYDLGLPTLHDRLVPYLHYMIDLDICWVC